MLDGKLFPLNMWGASMKKIKVLIVDDHMLIREGLKQMLLLSDNIEVIGEAASGFDCLKFLEEKSAPDIILMDKKMPGISGIDTTKLVTSKYPNIKVIVLTIYNDDQYVSDAIEAGAKGYVLKNIRLDELIKSIHQVIEEGAYLDPGVTAGLMQHLKRKDNDGKSDAIEAKLSKREFEVLNELVAGNADRSIAEKLFISVHTVRTHIKKIYIKLGVNSKVQLVAKAIETNLITLKDKH